MVTHLRLEELAVNAQPALETLLYDGWILRFAEGYTKRANSVQALYGSSLPFEEKLDFCERAYTARGLPLIFKLTPWSFPADIDSLLEKAEFAKFDFTTMMVADSIDHETLPHSPEILVERGLSEDWLSLYCCLTERKSVLPTVRKFLGKVFLDTIYVSYVLDGKRVGCGLGVVENDWVGLFDIYVGHEQRRRGIGRAIVSSILGEAKRLGAGKSYLQVFSTNAAAKQLYKGFGFTESFEYWYRKKDG